MAINTEGGHVNPAHVIPALPGYELLSTYSDVDEGYRCIEIEHEPIIGWRLGSHTPEPITVSGAEDVRGDIIAIRYPDGRVYMFELGMWKDEEAWLEYLNNPVRCSQREGLAKQRDLARREAGAG